MQEVGVEEVVKVKGWLERRRMGEMDEQRDQTGFTALAAGRVHCNSCSPCNYDLCSPCAFLRISLQEVPEVDRKS
jgi:predicted metal-binding protein